MLNIYNLHAQMRTGGLLACYGGGHFPFLLPLIAQQLQ